MLQSPDVGKSGVEEETTQNGEEAEEEVELPPPMKPINEPILVPPDESQGHRVCLISAHIEI